MLQILRGQALVHRCGGSGIWRLHRGGEGSRCCRPYSKVSTQACATAVVSIDLIVPLAPSTWLVRIGKRITRILPSRVLSTYLRVLLRNLVSPMYEGVNRAVTKLCIFQPSNTSSSPPHSPRSATLASQPLSRKARPTRKTIGTRSRTKTVKSSRLIRREPDRSGTVHQRSLRSSLLGIFRRRRPSSCPLSARRVSIAM